jgi:acyl-CoA thioester hydrolase
MIREHHLDTFGHVNNSKYLEIFEDARWDLIGNRGYGLEKTHAIKIGPVILGVEMKFQAELKNRENIVVTSQCTDYVKKVGHILQKILKENGEESCTANFTFALFNLNSRRIIPPTPEWLSAIGMA